MGANGIPPEHQNGGVDSEPNNVAILNGAINQDHKHHSSKHKQKDKDHEKKHRKETEEERLIRKEKYQEREEHYKKEGKRLETEEERKIRKEKERDERNKNEGQRQETEEERAIRKERERREREERHKKEGRREETEDERRARKDKERREREERLKREGRREETEEERRIRKEKERREKEEKHRAREKDEKLSHKETKEERQIRKERERREKKAREACGNQAKIKEDIEIKREFEDSQDNDTEKSANEEDYNMECDVKEEPRDSEEETVLVPKDEKGHNYENAVKKELQNSEKEETVERKTRPTRGVKRKEYDENDDDDKDPLPKSSKKKRTRQQSQPGTVKKEENFIKKEPKNEVEEQTLEEGKPVKVKKVRKQPQEPAKAVIKEETKSNMKIKKEKEEAVVWKWWEEENEDGKKWNFLQHKGPLFAPPYQKLPDHVRFYYKEKVVKLSLAAEEMATFYGKMLDHDYTTKEAFNKNFFRDWRKVMNDDEREVIRDLSKCDFTEIDAYFKTLSEQRKNRSKEEKKEEKAKNEAIVKEYGVCIVDGYEQKVGNIRLEPPGLFRGRGEHPKMGSAKHRIQPEDVTINCSADSVWPKPPEGHTWKNVQHDNKVTWLATWVENVQNQNKYVMLNPSSKLKGQVDMMKYEKARKLKLYIDEIRNNYKADLKSREMRIRQRAVALYFIDKLALRAGNEKDEDAADTVGCCSLRVEHITLHPERDGKQNVVEFDFLGKDSIRYYNAVPVDKRVYKNVQLFMENKKPADDLFDRLSTAVLNAYLHSLMPELTAKVFRTYNASITLQDQLQTLTNEDDTVIIKMLSYNRANRKVAVLCNHQRAIPKSHETSMENLQSKISLKKEAVILAEEAYTAAKEEIKEEDSKQIEKKKIALERVKQQLNNLETQHIDKDENKTIALGTSKLNYLDPRISVAWCKKFGVPIEKVYSKTQREKFNWAIEMAGPDYVF